VTTPISSESDNELARFAGALTGQYELECEVGRGGMGVVYRARDLKLDRLVAIKTLPPHLAGDAAVRERFLREARTAARLSQQNIVPVHRADEIDGRVFFVMGYVQGDSLAQRIRALGKLEPMEVWRDLRDVAAALAFAHEHGVIHRDVKAENILLDANTGRAMVTDFGIARLAEAAPLTSTGQLLGTVYYLSPEQVAGEAVDARSDIYALGVVGFLALSGRFPFDAELASAVLIAHVTKPAPSLRSVAPDTPAALADIIDRCLSKQPSARFQNCAEVIAALDDARLAVETAPPRAAQHALVSDTEAQAIWKRAAELQAVTGIVPRPVMPAAPVPDRSAPATSGFELNAVRSAADEAGIPTKYVEQAIAERGFGTSAISAVVDRSPPANKLAGARTRLEFEIVVDGEVPMNDYDLLVDIIRRETGEAGSLGSLGRSFTWQSAGGRRMNTQVSVIPRGGKTVIRVSQQLRGAAGGFFGGLMGGWGGGSTGLWIGIGATQHNPLMGVGLWVANIGLAYLAARTFFGRTSRREDAAMRKLAEAIAAEARVCIDASRPKLGA
jgi:eukaryotic-like serine/threonine-protein kinase